MLCAASLSCGVSTTCTQQLSLHLLANSLSLSLYIYICIYIYIYVYTHIWLRLIQSRCRVGIEGRFLGCHEVGVGEFFLWNPFPLLYMVLDHGYVRSPEVSIPSAHAMDCRVVPSSGRLNPVWDSVLFRTI